MFQFACKQLLDDTTGAVISIEIVLLGAVTIIGLTTGLTSARDAFVAELSDSAGAIQDLNQCYLFNGLIGHSSFSHGSDFIDSTDHCDDNDDLAGQADNCIAFTGGPGEGGDTVTTYTNADNTTDISASQNSTTLKWELQPGQQAEADAVTQAILDCIAAGHAVEITWTNTSGQSFTFTADAVLSGGPESFGFSGSNTGANGSGKVQSVSVSCPDGSTMTFEIENE